MSSSVGVEIGEITSLIAIEVDRSQTSMESISIISLGVQVKGLSGGALVLIC